MSRPTGAWTMPAGGRFSWLGNRRAMKRTGWAPLGPMSLNRPCANWSKESPPSARVARRWNCISRLSVESRHPAESARMSAQQQPAQSQSHQPGREYQMRPQPDYEAKYPGVGKLKGKVALITGGDSGIGRAVAVAMAREGAKIGIVYLDEDKDADDTLSAITSEGSEGIKLRGDIGKEEFCSEVVDHVIERFGRLDILVNNAGEQHEADDPLDISAAQLQHTFQTNIFSMFYLVKAALPHLKKGSSIINTTSVTAYKGNPELLDYSATKGAIVAFTRSLSQRAQSSRSP